MAFTCYAVLSRESRAIPRARTEDGRPRRGFLIGDREEPAGYHATEAAATAAKDRWAQRHPKRKWRVASLVEAAKSRKAKE